MFHAKLASIQIGEGEYELKPAFDPSVQYYTVDIPLDKMHLHLEASADSESTVSMGREAAEIEEGVKENGKHKIDVPHGAIGKGKAKYEVHMHDNTHLPPHVPPRWSRQVPIHVLASDGKTSEDYMVTVNHMVSRFSKLKNISVGDSPCILDPPFTPDVTEYACMFWWEKSKYVEVAAHKHTTHRHTQTRTHADTQTRTHADTQNTDTQTHRHSDT